MYIYKLPYDQNPLLHQKQATISLAYKCPFCRSERHSMMEEKYEHDSYGSHTISKKQRVLEVGRKIAKRNDLKYAKFRCYDCKAEWRSDLYIDENADI